ncbi:cell division ATP-binding protein FtsE [Fastidiosipila sanguinis]|uniref:Cell division ATP-binding protein FtsE n=1 Tax=Fastidiosipila sanguinis TaxID=236753 RepID=A0A2S0KLQ5_9FIRM|nr:cell division ATP-binding protein FtsE [Fastidiosipila sanguinis]AVM41937.1 cell division ATP-binding protein FtsE [Fastidiosipila sanguinis]
MLDFKNVSMSYTKHSDLALNDVSFHINPGEFVFVIGASGSGKSTVIKLISCEEEFQDGEIIVGGTKLSKIKKRAIPYLRRNLGMVFQDFRLIESKTVFENVAFAMEILGKSKRQISRQVPLVLSTVGLRSKKDAYPNELSGGEQQRVGIARALVNNPDIILADEPTGNLDPDTSEQILGVLKDINESGTTVIVCTHDISLVEKMQERVIQIKDGSLYKDVEKYS